MALCNVVREQAAAAVVDFRAAEMWIAMKGPAVSDGNNFGVDVQNYVAETMKTMRQAMQVEVQCLFAPFHASSPGAPICIWSTFKLAQYPASFARDRRAAPCRSFLICADLHPALLMHGCGACAGYDRHALNVSLAAWPGSGENRDDLHLRYVGEHGELGLGGIQVLGRRPLEQFRPVQFRPGKVQGRKGWLVLG